MATHQFHANPFPGIRSYEIHENHLFFGREFQVRELIGKLTETRFLAIVGSSGCGKSSLIKAGLIPELSKTGLGTLTPSWKVMISRPADNPIGNLAAALAGTTRSAEQIDEELRSGSHDLAGVMKKALNDKQSGLLVIDQFEELFRFKKNRTSFRTILDARKFIDLIFNAVHQDEVPIYVVISMRTDFLDDCTEFRGLSEMINQGYYLVPRMNNEERRHAITGPITTNGSSITDELVQRLLDDVGDDPDQLPILQHAMMRTWEYWTMNRIGDQPIGLEHYLAIGTMKEALSVHLEEIYGQLRDTREQIHAEKLFKALTDITKDSRGTRRPTQLNEICTLANAREDEIVRIIDHFRSPGCAFLMPAAHISIDSDSTIDISHESIMRVWTRLRKWAEEESESAQLYLRLSKSAELYQEGKTGLWVNPELQLGLQWKDQTKPNATWAMRYDPAFDRAISFLDHSKKQFELSLAKKETQQKRNLKRARNSAIILGIASLVSILFLIISLNLRFKAEASRKEALEKEKLAVFERKKTEEQRKEAILQKKISEQQQQIAEQQEMITEEQRQYAVKQQIIAQEQTVEAIEQKKQADISKQEAIVARDEAQMQRKEALSQKQIADQERVKAEESEKNTQRLRLLAIARTMAIQASQLVNTVRDDFPGLLAVEAYQINRDNGGVPNDPVIYNALSVISGDAVILRGHEDGVRSIVISKDGKTLFSCGDDDRLIVWNLDAGHVQSVKPEVPKQLAGVLRSLGLTHDGNWLIAGTTDGDLAIWNRHALQVLPKVIKAQKGIIHKIATHPSGNSFVTAGSDGKLMEWSYKNDQFSKTLLDSVAGSINCVSYSIDGSKIAYGTSLGVVRFRDSKGPASAQPGIISTGSTALSVTFTADGKSLYTGLADGTIKAWNLSDLSKPSNTIIGRHTTGVTAMTFSHDGSRLATSGFDRTIKLSMFPPSGTNPISIENHELWVYDIIFSTDDHQLISCSADKTIRIFSTNNSNMADQLKKELKRNMTLEEWQKIVGGDIPYKKTRDDLP